jgi:hypothetical protein
MPTTCRDEVLKAARNLAVLGDGTFTPDDIVRELARRGTPYALSTIRTHVTSRMCAKAPGHHGVTYADLVRVGPALYRLKNR